MDIQSLIENALLFLQYNQFISIALIVGFVVFLLWKPKVFFKLVLWSAVFAAIFYGVFYFGSFFTGGIDLKKEAVHKTEKQIEQERLETPPRQ